MTFQEIFNDWSEVINFNLLVDTLNKIPNVPICPAKANVFKAFSLCPLRDCKVVFVGQDPYPQKDVATGILFGNSKDTPEEKLSPSLNILREAAIDCTKFHNYPIDFDITLESWARQGILMLNSALTVEMNKIGSHTNLWRPFVSQFLQDLSSRYFGIMYVLFGQQAQTFEPYIKKSYNCVLKENHPAYYARTNTRMPSTIFTQVNNYLKEQYNDRIVWYKEFNEESI